MIFGVGTDVVELARMRRVWTRWGERAVSHMLTEREAQRMAAARDPARFLALYFAGKESVVKALGTGFCPRMTLHDVEIVPDVLGRPEVGYSPAGGRFVAERGGGKAHLSLSDDAGVAFAVCVMMRRD